MEKAEGLYLLERQVRDSCWLRRRERCLKDWKLRLNYKNRIRPRSSCSLPKWNSQRFTAVRLVKMLNVKHSKYVKESYYWVRKSTNSNLSARTTLSKQSKRQTNPKKPVSSPYLFHKTQLWMRRSQTENFFQRLTTSTINIISTQMIISCLAVVVKSGTIVSR